MLQNLKLLEYHAGKVSDLEDFRYLVKNAQPTVDTLPFLRKARVPSFSEKPGKRADG